MPFGRFGTLLQSRGFESFLWTQFLGAFNDSVYKIVVTLLAVNLAAGGSGGRVLFLASTVFILPFFLFSGYAGHLADVRNKRSVLIATKSLEIISMLLAVFALYAQDLRYMLAVLFLMALQSTLFSPAKYGILPEMVPDRDLSRANALVQMSTNVAIILGTWLGGEMLVAWKGRTWLIGCLLAVVAVGGFLTSFGIARVRDPETKKPFQLNPWAEIVHGLRRIYRDKPLRLTVLGISYFWFLGALLQLMTILFARDVLVVSEEWTARLITFLGVGIGLGSLAAGRLSGDKVELGLTPLGSIGMGFAGIWLAASGSSYLQAGVAMSVLGFTAGLFIVPLNSLLQQKSGSDERGRLIAANNFLNMIGVLLASGAVYVCSDLFRMAPDRILFVFGLVTFAVTVYILALVPDFLIRFCLWLLTHTVYSIRIIGQQHVPFRGPALLVSNHVSYVDAFLIGGCVQRFLRFLVYRPYYEMKALHWILRRMNTIPIQGGDPERVAESIELAREQLRQGHVVCIFAEGSITRTGGMLPFKRGLERIIEGLDAPIIPVNLDRVWGSVFSFKDGRFLLRWPERFPYRVTVSFGDPLASTATAEDVRLAVMELGSEAAAYRVAPRDQLQLRFIRTAKRRWFSLAATDSSGVRLSYGGALVEALLTAGWLRTQLGRGKPANERVGLLVLPSVQGAVANVAVLLGGRIPINLDARDPERLAAAVRECEIETLVCSRRHPPRDLPAVRQILYLEDALERTSTALRALVFVAAFLLPSRLLQTIYREKAVSPESMATVVYTAGTAGPPKAVILSHRNILVNVDSLAQLFWVENTDRVVGVLPFHYAFGLTVTLWFPLLSGCGAIYHHDAFDSITVGKLTRSQRATIIVGTPAMYSTYVRDSSVEDFASLRYALLGGEAPSESLAAEFEEKFLLPLIEGYGCTEMSPVVAVNVPNFIHGRRRQIGSKPGTVGHPLPAVSAKVVDPHSGETLPSNIEGMLLVKGPSLMRGYLGDAAKTSSVMRDGWFVTGDTAAVDEDGFIRIVKE